MPLLTINSTRQIQPHKKKRFLEEIAEMYADTMDSETRFLSVNLQTISREDMWLGRADLDSDIIILEADIREGRPTDQRRSFALRFMEKLYEEWEIPQPNMKVVFTEHRGTHMMGYDRVGSDWTSHDE